MSLLDAAQRLIDVGPPMYDGICLACYGMSRAETLADNEHATDCPWLALPAIVAALAAAEGYHAALARYGGHLSINCFPGGPHESGEPPCDKTYNDPEWGSYHCDCGFSQHLGASLLTDARGGQPGVLCTTPSHLEGE